MKFLLKILLFKLLFTGFLANAQLPVPVLDIAVLDETCDGTGQLTFNLTGIAVGADVQYSVFLLPNVTVPVYFGSNSVISLPGGTYNVVAVQTLGAESNFVTVENIVIEDLVGALDFRAIPGSNPCGGGSQLTVIVTSGEAVQYEIMGPVNVPPQTSNVFAGLPQGEYVVRVYDPCGAIIPKTVVIGAPDSSPPVISDPVFEEIISTDCNSVTITNTLSYSQGTIVVYPLTVVYTLHPGDGSADVVTTITIPSGDAGVAEITNVFPLVPGRTDTYDILVTNGCGIVFPVKTGMVTIPVPQLSLGKVLVPCGRYYLTVTAQNFVPPYQLNFLTPPPTEFDPESYNSDHPGPFTDSLTAYGGLNHAVPEGNYTVEITDACGRTGTSSINIVYERPTEAVKGYNNGCFSLLGFITARIPGRTIVFAEIIHGPPAFTETTPFNVSSFINQADGTLRVTNLPLGDYRITLIDSCGERYDDVPVTVPEFEELDFLGTTQPDCAIGLGGVKIDSPNGALVSMEVTMAPPEFNNGITPVDVSEFIGSSGDLFMDALPEGLYRFEGTDRCGIERVVDINVLGAQTPPDASVVLLPRCNAFNLDLFDTTAVVSATYWLQMENPDLPGQWVNPETSAAYTEGTLPNSTNSIALINNQTNINFDYSGTFRVVKAYQAIGSGVPHKDCISVLGDPFSYSSDVVINNIYALECRPNAVYVDATGLPPLNYSIDLKDGLPFNIDNGTNPIFTGLAPATYRFRIRDACTEEKTQTVDIRTIPNIVTANPADDMQVCIESGDSAYQEFNLEERTLQILGSQSAMIYTVTYHRTPADAISGNDPITGIYTNVTNPQTIYARVIHNFINICPRTASFQIITTVNPVLRMPEEQYICADIGRLVLSANEGYEDYQWTSDHPITQLSPTAIEVYEPGIYTVNVSRIIGTLPPCTTSVDIEVFSSEAPQNITVAINDWTINNNAITVHVEGNGEYEYSLDGENFQGSPVFSGLEAGIYTVYVNDKSGCGMQTKEVALLNYPKFFTPNGDGTHETWHIKYSWLEPDMIIYIYDRFGKLITSFDAESAGWDGTFHGNPLPSTDYWFVVNRQDGRVLKGHFSLLR